MNAPSQHFASGIAACRPVNGTVPDVDCYGREEELTVSSEYRNGMLGTLKSELDDSDSDLHEDFDTLASLATSARAAFMDFRLKPERAGEIFKMLRIIADDGQEWTMGPASGSWYHRPVGTTQWFRSSLPLGLTPVYSSGQPGWLTEGIGEHLVAGAAEAAEDRPDTAPAFGSGILNPLSGPAIVVADGAEAPALPKPVVNESEELDWLESEWSDFDRDLEQLRQIRTSDTPQVQTVVLGPTLPDSLPAGWNADVALTEAVVEEPEIARREDSTPQDPEWQPQERGGYTSPDTFFLPPD